MSKYQQEWKQKLQGNPEFNDWKIRASGGDLLILVPEETDMDLLKIQFSDLISPLAPLIKSPRSTIKFYVGRESKNVASFYYNINKFVYI